MHQAMHANDSLSNRVFSKLPMDRRALKTFLYTLLIVVSARTIPTFLRRKKVQKERKPIIDRTAIQVALIPTLLPRVYPYLRRQFGTSGLAELLSSSFLLLFPPSWRIHTVLYAISSALYHSVGSSRVKRYLPPTWTLNVVGNALLLQAFLFKSQTFPRAYERVILSRSTYYVPPRMTRAELEGLFCTSTFSKTSPGTSDTRQQHAYELCAKLHPTEPSCLKNYLKACLGESLQTSWWVGAFSALPFLMSRQKRAMIKKNPCVVLQRWLYSTLRGTIFVSFSITTAWAMTCLLQRVLPKERLRRVRWSINAAIASLWILVLPDKRRVEISLYVARLAAVCSWRAWRLEGGTSIPFGDVILLALSWIQLTRLQRRGEKISGLVGLAMSKIR